MKRLIRKADTEFEQAQVLMQQLSGDLDYILQEFEQLTLQGGNLGQRIQTMQQELQQIMEEYNKSRNNEEIVASRYNLEKYRQMAENAKRIRELTDKLRETEDFNLIMQIHENIQQCLQEIGNINNETQQEEKQLSL